MASDTIKVRLILDDKDLDDVSNKAKGVGKKVGKDLGAGLQAGFNRAAASVALLLSAVAAVKKVTSDFVDYERALAGVAKTTDIVGPQLEALGNEIQQLSTVIPVSTEELLRLAQVAGQFGVTGTDNILKFTETVGKLQFAIEGIDPETAAQSLTRILNVTKQGVGDIDTLSSSLVALGNNFEATEGEILTVSNEVARSTAVFGVSAQEALGLGAALKAVGVRAEGGGTAVGKAFSEIATAISSGGERLALFSEILGISSDQLKKDFGEDAIGVFEDFINSLSKSGKTSVELISTLKALGLSQDRVKKTLLPIIQAQGKLSAALKTSRSEIGGTIALDREFNRVNQTLAADLAKLRNELTRTATILGSVFGTTLRDNIQFLKAATKAVGNFFGRIAGTEAQKLAIEIDDVNDSLQNLRSQQLDLQEGGKGLDGFFLDTEKEAAKLQPRIDSLAKKYGELVAQQKELLKSAQPDGGEGAADPADPFSLATLTDKVATFAETLTFIGSAFGQTTTGLFSVFTDELFNVIEFTEEGLEQLNKAFNQKLASGISNSVQVFVGALAKGQNAFKALGKNIFGLIGDLSIQIGTFVIAAGVAKLALLKDLSGKATIAAGIGLVALGSVLKAIGGSGFGGAGGDAGVAGGGATPADSGITSLDPEETAEPKTVVNVSIDGVVSDPQGVAQQLSELLSDFSDSNGGFIVNEV